MDIPAVDTPLVDLVKLLFYFFIIPTNSAYQLHQHHPLQILLLSKMTYSSSSRLEEVNTKLRNKSRWFLLMRMTCIWFVYDLYIIKLHWIRKPHPFSFLLTCLEIVETDKLNWNRQIQSLKFCCRRWFGHLCQRAPEPNAALPAPCTWAQRETKVSLGNRSKKHQPGVWLPLPWNSKSQTGKIRKLEIFFLEEIFLYSSVILKVSKDS